MNDFTKLLEEWLDFQPGTLINDHNRIDTLISAARNWGGMELDLVDSLAMVLTAHTKLRRPTIEKLCRDMKVKIGLGVIPRNHFEFVDAYCKKHNVKYTLDKQLSVNGVDASDRDIFNEIFLFTGEFGVFTGRDYISSAWQKWKTEQERRNVREFYNRIKFEPTAEVSGWETMVATISADLGDKPLGLTRSEYRRLLIAIWQGAIWRVKAKLISRTTLQHIMVYLRGRQGCGKSSFMRWFLGPVADGMIQADFGIFDHDEKQIVMKNTPIIFFDEVARADKADAAKVKNMMTAETGMFRKLYGEASKGRMVSTFFGAGNLDLVEVFFDPTGLRRFFQHEIRQDLFRHLEDLFAQVDPLDLWKSVDENGPCPLENPKIVDLLIRTESAKRTMTPVEEWIKSVMDGGGWQQHRGTADMFEMFTTWRDRFFPHDKSNLSSFQTQLGRVLRDGDYPHDKKLDPVTRRAIYRLGEPPVETPEFIDTRNSIVVAIDKARARADARRGSNLENITKTA